MSATQTSLLTNGMHVLTQRDTHYQSATVGLFIKRGSRHEAPGEEGLCHFLEHSVFKGTGNHGARALAEAFDHFGCQTDAFTTKEETSFSIKVLGQHLEPCLDLWLAMIARPSLDAEELNRERMVILEEIKMEEDNPEDRLQERCFDRFWQDHPLAKPILGLPHQIETVKAEQVRAFHATHYVPASMIVVAVGAVDHDMLCQKLLKAFPKSNQQPLQKQAPPVIKGFRDVITEEHLEQVNFNIMLPGLTETDERRWALRLLSSMLGGGMSSRLFQSVRELRGLAYAIGSYYGAYHDTGHVSVYGGCSKENLAQVIQLTFSEIQQLCEQGPSQAELTRARNQSISGLTMAQESSYARMQAHASYLMAFQQPFELSRSIASLQGVTAQDIRDLARQLFQTPTIGYGAIGPVEAHLWETILDQPAVKAAVC